MIWNLEGGRAAEVLLVEDNDDDVVLARMGFARVGLPVHVHHVVDGVECLRFLRREPPWAEAPTPDLVLLDLNLPRMDGRAALAAIRGDAALCHLPVVVLTTSAREEDVIEAFRLHCSGYVVKPLDLERFLDMIRQICAYWFSTVTLPRRRVRG